MIKKKYISLAKTTMQNTIAYRSAYLISLTASFIFVMSMFYLWRAIYADRGELAGYTWDQMKAYLFVTFLTNSLLSWYSETRISWKIISGDVAMDLLKPLDFQKARIAETVGSSLFEGGVAIVMIGIVLLFTQGILLPANGIAWGLFILSLAASLLIKFGIVYIAGLLCFWTSSAFGIAWGRAAITNLFSGALVPLAFFPGWLERIALLLPFQGIVYIPASIYLGHLTGLQALQHIGLQLVWVGILWGCGKVMWSFAVRQVTIHGG